MPRIPSTASISRKWARVTPGRTQDYAEGVADPTRDWQQGALEAEASYNEGIQAALARGAFASGVRRAGTDRWQERTLAKGPSRWAQGVSQGENDFENGFAPYRETISQTQLPARGPAGSPQNIERVRVLAEALHRRKIELQTS